jgi:valyl-tRNA synthetase
VRINGLLKLTCFSYEQDSPTEPINQWIISRLNQAITESNEGFEQYDLSKSTNAIYNFWLYEFCDVYLEAIKPVFWDRTAAELESPVAQETRHALYTCVEEALRLIHPYMPFISEELWQRMPRRDSQVALPPSICLAQYPQANPKRQFGEIESQFTAVSTIVHAVRALRMEYGVVKKVKPVLVLNSHGTDNHGARQMISFSCI